MIKASKLQAPKKAWVPFPLDKPTAVSSRKASMIGDKAVSKASANWGRRRRRRRRWRRRRYNYRRRRWRRRRYVARRRRWRRRRYVARRRRSAIAPGMVVALKGGKWH